MTENRAPVPLRVRQAALTTLRVPGVGRLVPVVGVWLADDTTWPGPATSPERAGVLPTVVVTAASPVPDAPGTVRLWLQRGVGAPSGPGWVVEVPAAHLLASVEASEPSTPLGIALLSGSVPTRPDRAVVPASRVTAMVLMRAEQVAEAVAGSLSLSVGAPPASAPRPVAAAAPVPPASVGLEEVSEAVARDQMWTTCAGIALGHQHALSRGISLGAWLDQGGDQRDTIRTCALQVCAALVTAGRDAVSQATQPGRLALPEEITERVHAGALAALLEGHDFTTVRDAFGTTDTVPAALTFAAGAVAASVSDTGGGSFTLARWATPDGRFPWWAVRAVTPLLLHHDTEVLHDLLIGAGGSAAGGFEAGPGNRMVHRVLHVASEALVVGGWTAAELHRYAENLDLSPAPLATVVSTCIDLLAVHRPGCGACAAVAEVTGTRGAEESIRVAAALWPLLADMEVLRAGHRTGDQAWLAHRTQFLSRWLGLVATTGGDGAE